jgi:hypothetical protein
LENRLSGRYKADNVATEPRPACPSGDWASAALLTRP